MFWMPYGVVKKLKDAGWEIKKNDVSGRNVFVFPNHPDWYLIDNGYINNYRWVFLSRRYGKDFDFGEKYQPLEIILGVQEVQIICNRNDHQIKHKFSWEDYGNLEILLSAYLVKKNIKDQRPEYYDNLININLKKIEDQQKEIDRIKQKIEKLKEENQKYNKISILSEE